MEITRREALAALAAGSATALLGMGGSAEAQQSDTTGTTTGLRVAPGKHELVPLPFDPSKLRGLSERLLVSHHENNYVGALKNLNKVEEQLASVTAETPGFVVAGLRERELAFGNSVSLHELYFGNLGGDGKPGGAIQQAVGAAFGGFARFEEQLRATGLSLAGGSGWAVLGLCFRSGDLRIHWSGNHTQSAAFAAPLLVLDMYEHAYHMDYGAAAARYIEAFAANVQWDAVTRRYERARKAWRVLEGS